MVFRFCYCFGIFKSKIKLQSTSWKFIFNLHIFFKTLLPTALEVILAGVGLYSKKLLGISQRPFNIFPGIISWLKKYTKYEMDQWEKRKYWQEGIEN